MISISMFVNTSDEYKIFRAITELDQRHYKTEFDNFIKCLIMEEYYFHNLECDTWQDVVSYMCDRLYEGDVWKKVSKIPHLQGKRWHLPPSVTGMRFLMR